MMSRGADGGEGVDDDLGVGYARQEVDVTALVDAVHDLEGQAIHVSPWGSMQTK